MIGVCSISITLQFTSSVQTLVSTGRERVTGRLWMDARSMPRRNERPSDTPPDLGQDLLCLSHHRSCRPLGSHALDLR